MRHVDGMLGCECTLKSNKVMQMNNCLNWKSVEKDGPPKERGSYLIKIKYKRPFKNYIPLQVGIDWYHPEIGMWDCYDSNNKSCVTHYIPIAEIPIP
jgi:hypothetical protein